MTVEIITAAAMPPLLLDEAKDQLRLTGEAEDAAISALIASATASLERAFGLAFVSRDVTITLQPCGRRRLLLPVRPLSAVQSVVTVSDNGTRVTLENSRYRITPGLFPRLELYHDPDGVLELTANAGFGADWNAVPADIQQALLRMVTHLYTHRGDAPARALGESGAADLMAPYRETRL